MTFDKLRAYGKVFARVRARRVPDLVRLLAKRPAIMAGVGIYETALLASGRVEVRLKTLAQIKAASLIGCPF
ncbi:MAG TPA: hypothetical protein VFE21_11205 [Rubrobacteraceae bacterium]|nr:hypothetical protein [Rubrobacteraceae bacterium]